MSTDRPQLYNNKNIRTLVLVLLGLLCLDYVIQLGLWAQWNIEDQRSIMWDHKALGPKRMFFSGMEFLSTPFWNQGMLFLITPTLMLGAAVAYMIWLYRGLRNLKIMGINTFWDAKWALFPLIFPPLLLFIPIILIRDMIDKNSQVYRVLGDGKAPGIRSNRSLQFAASVWWTLIIGARLYLVSGISWWLVGLLFDYSRETANHARPWTYALLIFLALALPLLAAARMIRGAGKLEDAVCALHLQGTLRQYRTDKIKGGKLIADHSGTATWYEAPETFSIESEGDGTFQDQSPPG